MKKGGRPRRLDKFKLSDNDPDNLVARFIALDCTAIYVDRLLAEMLDMRHPSHFSIYFMDTEITPERYKEYAKVISMVEKNGVPPSESAYRPKHPLKKRKGIKCQACGEFTPMLYCATEKTAKTFKRGTRYRKIVPVFKDVGKKMCKECRGNLREVG